tara:strand:- start:231 stop:461 length:231 start_codon:yes stop_codon:yes gene_type:complete
MKELEEALKFIQNKLQGHDRMIITAEGSKFDLVSPEHRDKVEAPILDAEDATFILNALQTEEEYQEWMENYNPLNK